MAQKYNTIIIVHNYALKIALHNVTVNIRTPT